MTLSLTDTLSIPGTGIAPKGSTCSYYDRLGLRPSEGAGFYYLKVSGTVTFTCTGTDGVTKKVSTSLNASAVAVLTDSGNFHVYQPTPLPKAPPPPQ